MLRWEKKGKESKEGTKGDGEINSARRVTTAYCTPPPSIYPSPIYHRTQVRKSHLGATIGGVYSCLY